MHCRTERHRASRLAPLAATLLTATALGASPALAQTAIWGGGVSSDWFTGGNWSGAQPDNTRDVVVNGTTAAEIAADDTATAGNLRVGEGAAGTLGISEGTLQAYHTTIGMDGGAGRISVVGPSSYFDSMTSLTLGLDATSKGELEILEGGTVSSNQGTIGDSAGAEGIVTIDGAGSNWSTRIPGAGMFVGYGGKGTLTVQNGGSVNTNGTWLGYWTGSDGKLVVTGTGSSYIDEGDMYVGRDGTGTLEINDSAYVEIFNSLYVNRGTVSVDGAETRLKAYGGVVVTSPAEDGFVVSGGATVESSTGYIDSGLGIEGTATATATVTGAGSSWAMGVDGLTIGLEGGGALLVTDGGRLEAAQIYLGMREGASGTLTISDGGQVVSDYVMMAGEVGATGTLRLESGGQLSAQQVERYDGAGTVAFDGGTLKLTANQSFLFSGFQTGDITLEEGGGTIDTGTYSVHMDPGLVGEGGFTKKGTGTLNLYGASTYEGPTLISAGTLRAREIGVLSAGSAYEVASGATLRIDSNKTQTIGSLAGAGTVQIGSPAFGNNPAGSAQLTLGGNDASTSFSGVLAGQGQLIKTGTGTLTLSGNNSFTGAVTVSGGGLNVLGTLLSSVAAESGTRLGGSGSYGAISVGDGAVLAPGNSIGALTTGTLSLDAGSIYEVELSDGGNTAGTHNDITHVTGNATIAAGAKIKVLAGNGTDDGSTYTPGLVYTIIDTTAPGNLSVAEAPEIIDNFAYLNFAGAHDGQYFRLTSSMEAVSFCLAGSTANQCAAGDALFALGPGNAGFALFQGLSEEDAPAALDAISGEAHASMQHVLEQSFAVLGQMVNRRTAAGLAGAGAAAGPMGYAAEPGNIGVRAIDDATTTGTARPWIGALGSTGQLRGDGNAAEIGWSTGGLALGYENGIDLGSGTGFGGVALGYQHGQGIVAARNSETAFDSLSAAAYGGWSDGASTLLGSLSVGAGHVATDRTIVIGNSTEVANADYWTQSANFELEASYAFELGHGLSIAPLGTLQVGWLSHPGFTETGAGAFNLSAEASSSISAAAAVGLSVGQQVELESGTLSLEGRALYEQSLAGTDATGEFSFAGGAAPFTIAGAPGDVSWVRVGGGLAFELTDGLALGASYDGRISENGQSHQASASLGGSF
ncbi:MAG TPA: autotransporter domain-containing protein [Devosia sp.]|jgi:T5SS/PEP-CTERM-associated repeat protein/autotransporter-associated beta strand protein|uniref:autotransporter domain-containing protein n=1 Tax=Devosia sp. TaxID=1871048 RepID=UPI002DDDBD07|nr:autotransporter domain-containing protein [Devosia sp.]HEV2514178.1 autotransporter domain-containing protein [Devosia sp.]